MIGRVLEIEGDNRYLSVYRGFVTVSDKQEELGKIDLDGVVSIIIASRSSTISSGLISELAVRKIPCIHCDRKFVPVSISQPVYTHFDQTKRLTAQFSASEGKKNVLWKQLVKAKIRNQANLLKVFKKNEVKRLERLAVEVKSGDEANREGQAARLYWPSLFGPDFRRNREEQGINSMLNYAYAILRSCVIRAIYVVGLNPSLPIHHSGANNAFCLADDLIEPYRPIADAVVRSLVDQNTIDLSKTAKETLAKLVVLDVDNSDVTSPLFKSVQNLCYSVLTNFEGDNDKLPVPRFPNYQNIESLTVHA